MCNINEMNDEDLCYTCEIKYFVLMWTKLCIIKRENFTIFLWNVRGPAKSFCIFVPRKWLLWPIGLSVYLRATWTRLPDTSTEVPNDRLSLGDSPVPHGWRSLHNLIVARATSISRNSYEAAAYMGTRIQRNTLILTTVRQHPPEGGSSLCV